MYTFMLYHDDDSYSNYILNGQRYDTHKRLKDREKLFCSACNMKQLGEKMKKKCFSFREMRKNFQLLNLGVHWRDKTKQ